MKKEGGYAKRIARRRSGNPTSRQQYVKAGASNAATPYRPNLKAVRLQMKREQELAATLPPPTVKKPLSGAILLRALRRAQGKG